jgi:hypothetical protein
MMNREKWLAYARRQGQKVGRMNTAHNIDALAKARFPRQDEHEAFMVGYLTERMRRGLASARYVAKVLDWTVDDVCMAAFGEVVL